VSAQDIGTRDWPELIRKPLGWVMLDPTGHIEGLIGWQSRSRCTAEQAHRTFTPRKSERLKELREGWVVRREEPGDRAAFTAAIDELTKEGS
jgi:hypothetical protein